MKKYTHIRELTIDGKRVKAGEPISGNKIAKSCLNRWLEAGTLTEVVNTSKPVEQDE